MPILSLLLAAIAAINQPQMVVSTGWLAANIGHPTVRVLDVTTIADYNRGHIQGAVFVDASALMVRRNDIPNELPSVTSLEELFRQAGLSGGDRVILTSKDPLLATRAWFTLDYLGWSDRAAILDGGNAKWLAERRPFTKALPAAKIGDFSAMVDPQTLISRDELKALLDSGEPMILLDARGDPKQYLRAGHIPSAECMPWTANTTLARHGVRVLRTPEQLEQAYQSMKVASQTQRIVVYCRTGTEASMTYFVLRYLGLHPSLYDGSFVEWSKTENVVSAEH